MKISDLKTRVADTLNLDVITLSSLITCINNCFADIQSRGYREFKEVTITEDSSSIALNTLEVPVTISVPEKFRRLIYLKVETEINWHTASRVNLSSERYKGSKDADGVERILFDSSTKPFAYYILNDKIIIDSKQIGFPIESIALGYNKELQRLAYDDASLDTEIDIRDDLADALVLYGIYFYATRSSLDPELSKEMLNRYRYFVEDILSNLYTEDAYNHSSVIKAEVDY